MSLRERIGTTVGAMASPWLAAASFARQARVLHPDGETFLVDVVADRAAPDAHHALAQRLGGPALARFSGAMWKGDVERFEVLGVALRFTDVTAPTVEPREGDQDLLFATIVSPFTMGLSPFTTDATSFSRNHYWAVSPFEVARRRVKFRLSPLEPHKGDREVASRYAALREEAAAGRARFRLEVRSTFRTAWSPLATIELVRSAALDEQALRFSPFRTGRGVVPRGLVHAMRRPAYAASQWARPRSASSTST